MIKRMMMLQHLSFIMGTLALAVLAAQNAKEAAFVWSLDAQFLLLLGGVCGVAWGLGAHRTAKPLQVGDVFVRLWPAKLQNCTPMNLSTFAPALFTSTPFLIAAITVIAFILRLWHLETSVHFFVDELNFIEGLNTVIAAQQTGAPLPLLHQLHWLAAFPRLFSYWQSWGVALAGHNFTGFRLASALLGTLTIPTVYLLGRHLFDRRVGLLAALLLATFPPHIHFSRLGLNNIADPLFGTLAMAMLARGLRTTQRGDFAWAGALLGMTQYFYEGGRLLYPVVMVGWILFHPPRRQQGDLLQDGLQKLPIAWSHLAALIITVALVMLPLYVVTFTFHLGLAPRLDSKGLPSEYWTDLLLSNFESGLAQHLPYVARTFLVYVTLPDQSFYYGGETALVLPYLVPVLLVGIVVVLWRGGRALLLILVLTALGNSLLLFSPWVSGYVVAYPALCLLIGVGLDVLWRYSVRIWRRVLQHPNCVAYSLTWVACICAIAQTVYYFTAHLDYFNQHLRPNPDTHDAIFRALEFPPNTYVHLVGDIVFYDFDIERMETFLLRPDLRTDVVRQIGRSSNFTADYLQALPRDADHAFFLAVSADVDVALLRQYFDVEGPFYSPYNVPDQKQFALYYAAAP
jgi:hypothetical protein